VCFPIEVDIERLLLLNCNKIRKYSYRTSNCKETLRFIWKYIYFFPTGIALRKPEETRSYLTGFLLLNFEKGKSDGEYRNSHPWIQYLQDEMHGLYLSVNYFFDPAHPINSRPDRDYALQEVEITREHQVSDLFNTVLAEWEQLPLAVFTLGQGLEAHALPKRASEASSFTCTCRQPWFAATCSSSRFLLCILRIKIYEKKALKDKVNADKTWNSTVSKLFVLILGQD